MPPIPAAGGKPAADTASRGFRAGDIPAKPGVYMFRDRFGAVIYVGKAANLRKRMAHYFQRSHSILADPKLRSLVNSIASWEFQTVRTENESLLLESRLIKEYAPRYNVLMRDDKRFLMVKINVDEPFPRLKLARLRKNDGHVYFGPFPHGAALRSTVEFLNRRFGLRSCRAADPGSREREHCQARIVKDCSEPCVGAVSVAEYRGIVDAMLKLLAGDVKELARELRGEMAAAAAARRFERAATLRDVAANLEMVFGARDRNFARATIDSSPGATAVADLAAALELQCPPEVVECVDISNIGGQMAVGAVVRFAAGRPRRSDYRRYRVRNVEGANDFAMVAEVVGRHFRRGFDAARPKPDLLIIDGGKGQLGAAIKALKDAETAAFPVIGLAKKREEIFLPGRSEPVVLPHDRPALKLLQAVRDEAHRFAISYHRELRARRIEESILDDIPGVGPERKRALLKAFGSAKRLRQASATEIDAKTPGLGKVLAKTVYSHLHAVRS